MNKILVSLLVISSVVLGCQEETTLDWGTGGSGGSETTTEVPFTNGSGQPAQKTCSEESILCFTECCRITEPPFVCRYDDEGYCCPLNDSTCTK